MGHIFMKYILLSFFLNMHSCSVWLVDIRSEVNPGTGELKQVNLVKKAAKIKNGSQIKFFMSKIMCNLLKSKGWRVGSFATAKHLRRSH